MLEASNADARRGDVLLVGQNERTRTVVQDMAGIRAVRMRPGNQSFTPARDASCLVAGVPVTKSETVVFSHRLDDLRKHDQLLVKASLTTDATGLGYAARISTRLFLADGPAQTEPGGAAAQAATWKGHLSKYTGFNCLPDQGPRTTQKFGVLAIRRAPAGPLYLNLVAVSAAPFGGQSAGDELPIVAAGSYLDVTRYPAELAG